MNLLDIIFYVSSFIALYFTFFLILSIFEKEKKKRINRLNKNPLVSIVVTCYNKENYILKTLESIKNQKYKNFELIIIDDASKDNSRNLIKNFVKDFNKRVKLIFHKKNKGKAYSLNEALKICKAKYFVTVDADSFLEENCLEKAVEFMEKNNFAASSAIVKVHNPNNLLQYFQYLEYILFAFTKKILSKIFSIHVLPGPFTIYRTKILKKVNGFDESSLVEDQEIAYRLQKNKQKIVQLDNCFVETISPKNLKDLYKQRRRWAIGSILTLFKYRNMILKKEFGDFSVYYIPSLIFSLVVPILIIISLIYSITISIKDYILFFEIYGGDFIKVLLPKKINLMDLFSTIYFSLDFSLIYLIFISFSISALFLVFGFKIVFEKINFKKLIVSVFFFIFYYLITSFFYMFSYLELIYCKILNKKLRW